MDLQDGIPVRIGAHEGKRSLPCDGPFAGVLDAEVVAGPPRSQVSILALMDDGKCHGASYGGLAAIIAWLEPGNGQR